MTSSFVISEIVKPMERGQITLPIGIRKKLKITPKTWLWVKLIKDKILIEPVEQKISSDSLSVFLEKNIADEKIYWQDKDTLAIKKIEKKSKKRLKSKRVAVFYARMILACQKPLKNLLCFQLTRP